MNPKELARKAGFKTVTALAKALEISLPALLQWERVPPKRAAQIEELTGGKLTFQMLRPDLFPKRKGKAA
jgi:DNA-binding transcriptional regulator YdaS (Cro superfamily)